MPCIFSNYNDDHNILRHFDSWPNESWYMPVTSQAAKRLKSWDPRKFRKISGKSENFIELWSSAQASPKIKIFSIVGKISGNKFSRSALFRMKARVCLKYFFHDCIRDGFFASKLAQASLCLICLTNLVTLRR